MVKLICFYTKGGAKWKTSLGDGRRVFKSGLRITTIGEVDEVNSWIVYTNCMFTVFVSYSTHLFDIGRFMCIIRFHKT